MRRNPFQRSVINSRNSCENNGKSSLKCPCQFTARQIVAEIDFFACNHDQYNAIVDTPHILLCWSTSGMYVISIHCFRLLDWFMVLVHDSGPLFLFATLAHCTDPYCTFPECFALQIDALSVHCYG